MGAARSSLVIAGTTKAARLAPGRAFRQAGWWGRLGLLGFVCAACAPPAPPESTSGGFGGSSVPDPAAAPEASASRINLNSVTFEQLRAQNLSVTQATRLLAHRERLGGFDAVDDLNQVAGLPDDVLADLKSRATV